MMYPKTFNLMLGVLSVAVCAGAQSDLDESVASIRESGMSESAASSVRTVAGILAGSTIFKATPAPDGSIGQSYSGRQYAARGSDPAVAATERDLLRVMAARRDSWTAFLKRHADTDRSGFVSTEEGHALRRQVEMALVADQLGLQSVEELERAWPVGASHVQADLASYAAMRAEAVKQGLDGMPPLPSGLVAAPR